MLLALLGCGDPTTPPEPFSDSVTLTGWCSLQPSPCLQGAGAGPIPLQILGAATGVGGDGTLTLTISGDLDNDDDETLHVEVEGIDLGILFNGDPADDDFDLSVDTPTDCQPITTTAVLPEAELRSVVADGVIQITLTPRQDFNDIDDPGCDDADEVVTATVEYPVSG